MKIEDLETPLHEMSDEEILERIRQLRSKRQVVVRKEEKKANKKLSKQTMNLDKKAILELLKELEEN